MDDATITWARTTARYLVLRRYRRGLSTWLVQEIDDIVSYALMQCLRAEPRYEQGHGAALHTFLECRIKGAIKDYFREHQRQRGVSRTNHREGVTREHVAIEHVCLTCPPDTAPIEAAMTVTKLCSTLPARQQQAIMARYFGELSMRKVGGALHVTEGRASQIIQDSLTAMRTAAHQSMAAHG